LKKLRLGIMPFSKIIAGGFLYADKTQYVCDLFRCGYDSCFLSQPRRLGKTRFLSALKQLFMGNRERFNCLWMAPRITAFHNSLSSF
jgi:hypothetical protein